MNSNGNFNSTTPTKHPPLSEHIDPCNPPMGALCVDTSSEEAQNTTLPESFVDPAMLSNEASNSLDALANHPPLSDTPGKHPPTHHPPMSEEGEAPNQDEDETEDENLSH